MVEEEFLEGFKQYDYDELFPGVRVPLVEIDQSDLKEFGLKKEESATEKLTKICRIGYVNKGIDKLPNKKEYIDRINYELGIIDKIGFSDYFLTIWDFIRFCKKSDILHGPWRGSASGSLVFYLIGVVKLDPIKYNLIFERFINETRASLKVKDGVKYLNGVLPDVDLDLDYIDRHKAIENYLHVKFKGRNCKTLTIGTFKTKNCLKDVGKSYGGISEQEMNKVTSMVESQFGKPQSIEETKDSNPQFAEWADKNKDTVDIVQKIVNLPRNFGVHASGYITTYDLLEDTMPFQLEKSGELISCYTKELAELSSLKLDFLGLAILSVIKQTAKDANYDLDTFDENDQSIYDILQDFKYSYGIFQLEGDTAKKLTQKIKPKDIFEVSDVSALARPGALEFVDQYAKYKETGEVEKIHPEIDKILNPTGNVLIFQEQLMQVSSDVFGLSLAESDNLRKCVGRKKKEEMQKFEKIIRENAKKKGIDDKVADYFWNVCNSSADYSFSLNHSLPYSYISVMTVYLKHKFPIYFFKNALIVAQAQGKMQEELPIIKRELDDFGIKLAPPDLIRSNENFTVDLENNSIRYGIQSIKSVSAKTLEKLKQFNSNQPSKFALFQAAKEAGINIGILSNLIKAGCLSSFGENRGMLMLEAASWNLLTESQKTKIVKYGPKYEYNLLNILFDIKEGKLLHEGKEIISTKKRATKAHPEGSSPWDSFYRKYAKFKGEYHSYQRRKGFYNYMYESDVLGFSYSKKLHEILKKEYKDIVHFGQLLDMPIDSKVITCGIIQDAKVGKTKKFNKKLTLYLSDEFGEARCMTFNYEKYDRETHEKEMIKNVDNLYNEYGRYPSKKDLLLLRGTLKEGNLIFADKIRLLNEDYSEKA
jgi:DNA polymerase-3 subunit alpha